MSSRVPKILFASLIIVAVATFGLSAMYFNQQYGTLRCEACGMAIMPEMLEHILITDASGNRHYACCQGCMLRLLDPKVGYEQLHIETFCDYYGPNYKIVIDLKEHGNITIVTPSTALILLGTKVVMSCVNNRIAYNQTAADALMSEGFSMYTMMYQQHPLPNGTPMMPVAKAAVAMAQKGISYMAPSPLVPTLLVVAGTAILVGSIVAYKKMSTA